MPGEHWCSICEEDLSKHKGTYTKLYWRGTEDEGAKVIRVVCPDCRKKDEKLDEGLAVLEDVAKPVEVTRGRVCSFCGESVKKKEKSLRAEFRYNGSETRADVCEKCLEEREVVGAIYVKGPNPKFELQVTCLSVNVCESFKKPGRDRGINCGHVCANMDGYLYCRRGHPGEVRVYRERWALPPSRRKLTKTITDLLPFFEKMKENAGVAMEILETRGTLDVNQVESRPVKWEPPEFITYEVIAVPRDKDGKFRIPWGAKPLDIIYRAEGEDQIKCLVPVEEDKDERAR